jgi:hypothetical protein
MSENKGLRDKAELLSNDLYPTIGEFVLTFESLCHELKMGIEHILMRQGLPGGKITEILIGDMTLFPLQNVFRALLVEAGKLDSNENAIIDNIFTRICKIGEERNTIIHSAWFIDFKNPEDIENRLLIKYRPGASKHGAKESPSKYPLENIKKLTSQTRALHDLIDELNMCIFRNVSIASRFKMDKDKNAITIGSIMDHFQTGKPPVKT